MRTFARIQTSFEYVILTGYSSVYCPPTMRLLLSKFCEYAAQQANGRHTMVGMFDNIVTPNIPLDHPPFFLCIQLEFEPLESKNDLDILALLIDEDGKEIANIRANGNVPTAPHIGMTRIFIQFLMPPIRFEKPGDYRLDVMVNGEKIGEERLPVIHAQIHPGRAPG